MPRPPSKPKASSPNKRSEESKRSEASIRSKGVPVPKPDSPRPVPTSNFKAPIFLHGGIRLVYEDRDVLVVDKPSGILTASIPGDDLDSVFRELKVYARNKAKRRGTQVWIVHRLDKEASGLLVFAKTESAFESLKEQFRAKRIHRVYSTVVEGKVQPQGGPPDEPAAGTIQSFLVEDDEGQVKSIGPGRGLLRTRGPTPDGEAKLAITHYRVAYTGQGRTFLHVRLETGRKNQIRVHMQEMGHSIVGDRRYGCKEDPVERVCLHATELAFAQTLTGQPLRFVSPPPASFFRLVGARPGAGATHETAEWNLEAPPTAFDLSPIAPSAQPSAKPSPQPSPLAEQTAPVKRLTSKPPAPPAPPREDSPASSWDHVADWYADLIEERGSDHHDKIIIPGTVRLLNIARGQRILDLACGQGNLCHSLAALGVHATGIDTSPRLVAAANKASKKTQASPASSHPHPAFAVGDARNLRSLDLEPFDAASCVMALMNIEPLSSVFSEIAAVLKPGGHFVAVILHPAFRSPGQTAWGWDDGSQRRDGPPPSNRESRSLSNSNQSRQSNKITQYRRVSGYLSAGQHEIIMNPGDAAGGRPAVTTITYHRPIQTYIRLLAQAGLTIDALEEWPSLRSSQPGPTAAEENRARREIPMFLAIRALKVT